MPNIHNLNEKIKAITSPDKHTPPAKMREGDVYRYENADEYRIIMSSCTEMIVLGIDKNGNLLNLRTRGNFPVGCALPSFYTYLGNVND